MSVAGMKILVTGASSGIGAHVSRYLAGQGAQVVAAARRLGTLEEMAAETDGLTALKMDVGDAASVEAGIQEAAERMDGLDGLFCNAGVAWGGQTMEMSEEDWVRVVDINLNGVWRTANAAAKIMVANRARGSILSTASILGFGTGQGVTAYAASKAGVVHLTRSLALEWARFRIRVNAIAPGYFPTEMTEPFLKSDKGQDLRKDVPMRRFGQLEELEGPVELLLGARGSYITGVTLPIDGGHLCRSL